METEGERSALLCGEGWEDFTDRKKERFGRGKSEWAGREDRGGGETDEQAAVRETQEEVGITPTGVEWAGELRFQFRDGYSLQCTVYRASGWQGELMETEEAKPFWMGTNQ